MHIHTHYVHTVHSAQLNTRLHRLRSGVAQRLAHNKEYKKLHKANHPIRSKLTHLLVLMSSSTWFNNDETKRNVCKRVKMSENFMIGVTLEQM